MRGAAWLKLSAVPCTSQQPARRLAGYAPAACHGGEGHPGAGVHSQGTCGRGGGCWACDRASSSGARPTIHALAPALPLAPRSQVNIVNADLLAKKRGLRVVETVVPSEGTAILSHMEVSVGASRSKFSSAVDPSSGTIRCAAGATRGVPLVCAQGWPAARMCSPWHTTLAAPQLVQPDRWREEWAAVPHPRGLV